jgi:hypothetical protein
LAYDKQIWADYPTGGTPISAARLNHMEEGIATAGSSASADAAQATANTALSTANTAVTKANNAQADVDALSATFEPATGGFTVAAGWTLNRGNIIKVGRVASCDISINRTGATITVGPSGNITNTLLGTVSTTFKNWGSYQGITAGPGGSVNSVYIQGTNVYLAAYAPSVNIVAGAEITFAGLWLTAS